MLLDRILGVLAIVGFVAFISVLIWKVPDLPLVIVLSAVLAMAAWDFWLMLRSRSKKQDPEA